MKTIWKKYFIFLLSLLPFLVSAQSWEWAKGYETPNTKLVDHSQSISKDRNDNLYITGFSWRPGGGGNSGWAYNWLKKFDARGNIIWSDTIPFYTYTKNISDAQGNTYIIGMATIAKFDVSGNQLWLKYVPHATLSDIRFLNGNLIISGYTQSYTSLIETTTIAAQTGFITKCDPNGNWLWVNVMASFCPVAMSISKDNLIFCVTDGANGNNTVRVTDENGNFINSFLKIKYGSKKICADNESNFYIFAGIEDRFPLIIDDDTIFSNDPGICLIKYNRYGVRQWYKVINKNVTIDVLLVDKENNLYVGGNILNTLQIDSFLLDNKGGSIYVVKFKPDGTVSWIEYSEQATPRGSCQLNQMVFDSDNNLVIAGAITDKHIFGDITVTGTDNLYADVLIAKIKQDKVIVVNETQFIISKGLNVYPNPTDGLFTAFYRSEKASALTLKIINQLGQVILVKNYPEQQEVSETFDLSRFAKGIYLIQVKTNETTEVKKIILK